MHCMEVMHGPVADVAYYCRIYGTHQTKLMYVNCYRQIRIVLYTFMYRYAMT
jgi:hypothetical protein